MTAPDPKSLVKTPALPPGFFFSVSIFNDKYEVTLFEHRLAERRQIVHGSAEIPLAVRRTDEEMAQQISEEMSFVLYMYHRRLERNKFVGTYP